MIVAADAGPFVYATSRTGTTHLTTDRRLVLDAHPLTLCGRVVEFAWTTGDETLTGVAADCRRCKQIAKGNT